MTKTLEFLGKKKKPSDFRSNNLSKRTKLLIDVNQL